MAYICVVIEWFSHANHKTVSVMTFDEAKVYVKEQATAQFEFPTNIISAVYEVLESNGRSIDEQGITADECDTMISDAWNRMQ